MKKAPVFAIAAVALLSLAACEHKPEEVDSRAPDPQASAIANAAPVELPPPIAASVTFRCQPGNTLIYVDFFQGDKQVLVKTEKGGTATKLKAPEAGQPYVGDGSWKLTGTSKAATIVLADGSSHSCKS
ncbi:hypothetical protein [Sphingomonas sp.]|uniref:hypothetical protein n=1 Tax=Sphingomonas sp. TaxID=28214 RepID=UPI001B0FB2A6|nr:hypothetical protein [Sphingomonas sp.]MBO9714932.1 hypothetical protein [Sphingomonas sp.]